MGEKIKCKYVEDIYSPDILLITDIGITARLKNKDEVIKALNGWLEIDYRRVEKEEELQDQLALTEKALELACKWINDTQEMDSDCPIYADCFRVEKDCDNWDCGNCDCSKFAIEHFKTKAKEMLK